MSAPICPHDGQPCTAACAGKPPCERAEASFVGSMARDWAIGRAENAVIEAARDCVTIWRVPGLRDRELCLEMFRELEAAVDALNALEAQA